MPKSRKGAPGVSGRSRCRWQGQIVGGSASLTAVVFVDGCQEGHTKGLIAGCSRSSEAVISMSERTPTAQTPAHTSIRNAIFFFSPRPKRRPTGGDKSPTPAKQQVQEPVASPTWVITISIANRAVAYLHRLLLLLSLLRIVASGGSTTCTRVADVHRADRLQACLGGDRLV